MRRAPDDPGPPRADTPPPNRFDLTRNPWVPVLAGGGHTLTGLRDLFTSAHEVTDVEVPQAPAAAGLWRILYLLAARVSGLDDCADPAEFAARRAGLLAAGRFDPHRVHDYFDRHEDRFGLFDTSRPWMQDPRLSTQCKGTSGLNRVIFGRPAKNGQVWFSHHTEANSVPVPAAEAALHLIATLYYGPSGRCTVRTVGTVSEGNVMAGPLRGSLSAHPAGENLFASLVAGIPPPGGAGPGAAPWEQAGLPDPLDTPKAPGGLGWLLAGRHQHAVLLTPGGGGRTVVDATLTWAWRERQPPACDPYLVYTQPKKGDAYPRPALAGRAPWRDLGAVLDADADGPGPRRPAVFTSAGTLPAEAARMLRLRVFGFEQDGQTRDRGFFTRPAPGLHLGMLAEHNPEAAGRARAAAEAATGAGGRLANALACAYTQLTAVGADGPGPVKPPKEKGPWAPAAEEWFWARAEALFLAALTSTGDAGELFTALAEVAYSTTAAQACPTGHRPRVVAALTRNRRRTRPWEAAGTAGTDDTESD